jgi:hypothetical protein
MPASKRPSFLKRQKELKRMERAAEKREAKRMRKERASQENGVGESEFDDAAPDAAMAEETEEGGGVGEIQH